MIVACLACGLEQEDRTGIPASKSIPREQGVSVCAGCGGIWAHYVYTDISDKGVVLSDGKRYLRVRDFPPEHPIHTTMVKHQYGWMPASDDPDMLVARA